MCIILVGKKEKVERYIKKAVLANPDGCGIAWRRGEDNFNFIKGLMTLQEVNEAFEEVPAEAEIVFHARLASAGAVVPHLTHPFRLTANRYLHYITLRGSSSMLVFHNGTLPFATKKDYESDTLLFAEHLSKFKTKEEVVAELQKYAKHNRFVLCWKGDVIQVGDFVKFKDKVLASNNLFLIDRKQLLFINKKCDLCSSEIGAHFKWGLWVCSKCHAMLIE